MTNKTSTSTSARINRLEADLGIIRMGLEALLAQRGVTVPKASAKATSKASAPKASKKAASKKAKASTAEREAQKEAYLARKAGNKAAAAWMREHGIVPSGKAWTAVKNGERNVAPLRLLNAQDGLVFGQAKVASQPKVESDTVPMSAIVAQVSAQFTQDQATKSAARVKAGRRAVQGRERDAKGRLLPKASEASEIVASEPSKGLTATVLDTLDQEKVTALRKAGLTDAQVLSALA